MKKTLSILLAVVMLLGVLPVAVSADARGQISSIVITDVDVPIIGETPDFNITVENADEEGIHCDVSWHEQESSKALSASDKFEKGKFYYCLITLYTDEKDRFDTVTEQVELVYMGKKHFVEDTVFDGSISINGNKITRVRQIDVSDKKYRGYKCFVYYYYGRLGCKTENTDNLVITWWYGNAKEGTYYTVTFESNGYGDSIEPKTVLSGKTINKPRFQYVRDMEFEGWYSDPEFKTKYDFEKPVTKNITLYAKWSRTDPVSSDETESVTEPEPVVSDYVCPFVDVPENEWYFPWVSGAHKMGLINGKDDTHYKPDDNMTYAEAIKLAACMNQLSRGGEITLENGEEHWYDTYVAYCLENGIISEDYSAVINESIDRQTYAAIFSKALPASSLEAKNDIPDGSIPDVQNDNPNYDAIYTLYRAGIINGSDSRGSFNPTNSIKRSEVAAILNRMMDASVRVDAPAELLK